VKLLVAEDDSASRFILKRLPICGVFEVTYFEDGTEAWEVVQQQDSPQIHILSGSSIS